MTDAGYFEWWLNFWGMFFSMYWPCFRHGLVVWLPLTFRPYAELMVNCNVLGCWIWSNILPLRPTRHFPDDIFNCSFLNVNVWISIRISLKFVSEALIDNKIALVQIMACCRPGDKPFSKTMLPSSSTHICVTRLQCVKWRLYTYLCGICALKIGCRRGSLYEYYYIITKWLCSIVRSCKCIYILALCHCGKYIMTFGGHTLLPPMAGCRCAICCFITHES